MCALIGGCSFNRLANSDAEAARRVGLLGQDLSADLGDVGRTWTNGATAIERGLVVEGDVLRYEIRMAAMGIGLPSPRGHPRSPISVTTTCTAHPQHN